ncbi:uncharacterized protein PFLUO_LOCUS138 [Penicillium psychrofluorescens]|uniref:uncharacterized protein n=1 Tax=Penicillium psychrofluorescens TaxID=3158075 RepID=UPI003CCD2A57
MWKPLVEFLALLPLLLQPSLANTDDQTSARVNCGSFGNPAALCRPRFRYWLPDASVDASIVQENIKAAGEIGAGGVELVPYYNYGGQLGGEPAGANWSKYGFGTPAFREIFVAALQAHKEAGLYMDFAMGPNQGQGVPAHPDDEGLQWDLEPFSVVVPQDGHFEDVIPGWGAGELVALVSAEVLSSRNMSIAAGMTLFGEPQTWFLQLTLKNGTLKEWTCHVSSTGHVSLELPAAKSPYRLFAFYQFQTHKKNLDYSANVSETIFDSGSYTVDHFSARGAHTTTTFWEEHLLKDGVQELLMDVGHYGWEDSLEIRANISWTPSLPELFKSKYGYNLKPFLPLVMFGDNNIDIQATQPGMIQCVLDTSDQGVGYLDDFRGALVEGYREYLHGLMHWLNSKLNLQISTQVSYNLPMDMEANIPFVNAPECESLQFSNNIDGYRQFSGPANLAGKRVISNEMGAVIFKAYNFPHSELLFAINSAVSGGVNQFVLHGESYTGDYYGTTWSGYTAFSYLFSEPYSDKQPSWNHGFGDILNYTARVQLLQQSGIPRTDVAIYNKVSATNFTFPSLYTSTDMLDAGYTYTYLSPDNFALPEATVQNGRLAPNGPAYKAMVITSNSNLTLEGVHYIQKYAHAGLTVIISGGDPGVYATRDGRDTSAVKQAIQSLKQTRNVYSVPSGQVAAKLHSLGLKPQTSIQTNGTWYSTWREDNRTGMDHAFIFCDTNASTGTVDIGSTKAPFILNPWTGEMKPALNYKRVDGRVILPLSLAGNQTVMIAFSNDTVAPMMHVTQIPSTVVGYEYSPQTGVILHIASGPNDKPLILSNGSQITTLATGVAPSITLSNWTLTVEHWDAPQEMSDASVIASKHNTTHQLSSLVSWTQIAGLQNASGIGYYTTSFAWPPSAHAADGAYLVLPPIIHAARITVNGQRLPPVDLAAPRANLGPYLRSGRNVVTIVVPTTMWNYLRSIFGQLRNAGIKPLLLEQMSTLPARGPNGLVGKVELVPYANVRI